MIKDLPPLTHTAEWHERLPRYACVAPLVQNKRVLDIGCGSGEGAALLAAAGAREVVAIDPSSALIEEARTKFERDNLIFLARYVEDPLDFGAIGVELDTGNFRQPADEAAMEVLANTQPDESAEAMAEKMAAVDAALKAGDQEEQPITQELEAESAGAESPAEASAEDEGQAEDPQSETEDDAPSHEAADEVDEAQDAPSEGGPSDDSDEGETSAADESDAAAEQGSDDAATAEPPAEEDGPEAASADEKADDEAGKDEGFDVILAINPGLPVGEVDFLKQIASLLSPGGCAIVSARVDSTHGFADLLVAYQGGGDAGEPLSFESVEAMRECFASVFPYQREMAQYGILTTRFEPVYAAGQPATRKIGGTTETVPRYRLALLGFEPLEDVEVTDVNVPLEALISQLCTGAEALSARSLSLEHRSVVYEEQLSQKDELIDNLEREVRSSNTQAREFESQVHAMRQELDGLQAELTSLPTHLPPAAAPESAPALRAEQIVRLEEQLSHAEAVAGHLRNAMEAQRATIEALTARLRWGAGQVSSPAPTVEESVAPVIAQVDEAKAREVADLKAELAAAESRVAKAEKELTELRNELAKARGEAKESAKKREIAQRDARSRIVDLEKKLANETRAKEAAEKGRDDAKKEAEEGLVGAEKGLEEAQKRVTELDVSNKQLSARVKDLEAIIEGLREERHVLQKQVGRFRRGRRQKRSGQSGPQSFGGSGSSATPEGDDA